MNLRASLFAASNLAILSSLVSSCIVEDCDDKILEPVVETADKEFVREGVELQDGVGETGGSAEELCDGLRGLLAVVGKLMGMGTECEEVGTKAIVEEGCFSFALRSFTSKSFFSD